MSQKWDDKSTTRRVEGALKDAPVYKYPSVTVNTFDGTVSLGGFVNTQGQKEQATQIVRNVNGVRQVIDNLVVQPMPTGRGAPVIEHPKQLPPPQAVPAVPEGSTVTPQGAPATGGSQGTQGTTQP